MSCRNHRIRDTAMSVTSSGGSGDWREEGEAQMLADGPYRSLIWCSTGLDPGRGSTAAVRGAVLRSADNQSTPLGREAGAIPAQSRYGDRPLRREACVSPVAGPAVDALLREKGQAAMRSTG
jgi:hypothetical protein